MKNKNEQRGRSDKNVKLEIEDCLLGMEKIMAHAKRLTREGYIFELLRSPTSVFLYAIAIEELTKAYYLGLMAIFMLENKSIRWEKFWLRFRDHKFKQTGLVQMMIVAQQLFRDNFAEIASKDPSVLEPYGSVEDFDKSIEELQQSIKKIRNGSLEKLKWQHLYVDYLDSKWSVPNGELSASIFTRGNIKTYYIDLNTMKNQIKDGIKK